MINIRFRISWPLIEGILRTKYDEKFLEKRKTELEGFLKHNKALILRELHRYTGLKWKEKDINIWLINGLYPTCPNPNLLNVSNKFDYVIFELVYLLTHNLFIQTDFYDKFLGQYGIDETRLEATVYILDKNICRKFFSSAKINGLINKAKGGGFSQYIWDEVKVMESKLDIDKEPLAKLM